LIFPGNHSDVGGGYPDTGLSDHTLPWMLDKLHGQGLRYDLANIRPLNASALAIGHDESVSPPWNVLPHPPREFPSDVIEGAPAFGVDAYIGARWGKAVTIQPGERRTIYKSTGVFSGDRPLYGELVA
jgi:hypothetical protein